MKKTLIAAASTAVLLAGCATTEPAEDKKADKKVLHTMESYDLPFCRLTRQTLSRQTSSTKSTKGSIVSTRTMNLFRRQRNHIACLKTEKSIRSSLTRMRNGLTESLSQRRTSAMRSSVSSKRTHRSLTCSNLSKKRQRSTTKRSESN